MRVAVAALAVPAPGAMPLRWYVTVGQRLSFGS
jgi:hypothetical protein